MYQLNDTFNGRTISSHRTLRAALMAADRHANGVRTSNGSMSYIPTVITDTETGETIHNNGQCGQGVYAYTRTTADGDEYGVE